VTGKFPVNFSEFFFIFFVNVRENSFMKIFPGMSGNYLGHQIAKK